MALLEPRMCVLDETDSGLDIDALRIVAEGVNALARQEPRLSRHHALPAAFVAYRARHGACDGRRPDREIGRTGARERARGEGLCRFRRAAGGLSHDRAHPHQDEGRDGAHGAVRSAAGRVAEGRHGEGRAEAAMAAFAASGLPHRRDRGLSLYRSSQSSARGGAARARFLRRRRAEASRPAVFWAISVPMRSSIVNGRLMDAAEPRIATAHRRLRSRRRADTAPTILDANDAVVALNTALSRETVTLEIGKGVDGRAALASRLRPGRGRAASRVTRGSTCSSGRELPSRFSRRHEGPNGIATQSNIGVEIAVGDGAKRRACARQCRGRQGVLALEPRLVARAWQLRRSASISSSDPWCRAIRSSLALPARRRSSS